MNIKLSAALLGGVMALAVANPSFAQRRAAAAAPAAAPVAAAPAVGGAPALAGIATADLEGVVNASAANRAAAQARQTQYKAQFDALDARQKALNAQIEPLATKYQNDAKAAKPDQNSLLQQATTLRQLQEAGQQELQTLAQPIALSEAYVQEQISEKLGAAVNAAMAKKRISVLLNPSAIITTNNNAAYDLSQDVMTELNRLIPTAQVVPPAGWEPRQVREAKAAQARAQGGAAAPAAPARPAGPQPDGR